MGVQEQEEENLEAKLRHQKDIYNARCKRKSRPYKAGDLIWLEEKALPAQKNAAGFSDEPDASMTFSEEPPLPCLDERLPLRE